jgi:hypothetical protein
MVGQGRVVQQRVGVALIDGLGLHFLLRCQQSLSDLALHSPRYLQAINKVPRRLASKRLEPTGARHEIRAPRNRESRDGLCARGIAQRHSSSGERGILQDIGCNSRFFYVSLAWQFHHSRLWLRFDRRLREQQKRPRRRFAPSGPNHSEVGRHRPTTRSKSNPTASPRTDSSSTQPWTNPISVENDPHGNGSWYLARLRRSAAVA